MNGWRWWSFHVTVAVDWAFCSLNAALAVKNGIYHDNFAIAALHSAVAAGLATTAWSVVWIEQKQRVIYATRESYVREQMADTDLKETMLAAMKASGDMTGMVQIGKRGKETAH